MIQFVKKIVYGKANTQKEMFREKMFSGKCPFRVIGTSDKSIWKGY